MTESSLKVSGSPPHPHCLPACVATMLAILTIVTFCGVFKNGFVDYDDNTYVFLNPNVSHGFEWQTIVWSFTETYGCNWHPLTWLSHALDCQLYGLNPAGHHVTNLILHAANVVLLFFALRLMTGSFWKSALVAALFGIHPLRVESVAWVAERKDLLSGLFFMLTLISYARFVQAREVQSPVSGNRIPTIRHFRLALIFFALGLMSKPMLVSMPFVLLLLDYWPFQRYDLSNAQKRWDSFTRLAGEKIPFFVLTVASCLITLNAQDSAVMSIDALPLHQRLGNAVQAYVSYLQQIFWPCDMAVFYPKPALIFEIGVIGALVILVIITLTSLCLAKKRPFIVACWLCYLGVLVPVIGVVQVGSQAQADRYTYLPSISICILVVWGMAALVERKRVLQFVGAGIAWAVVMVLCVATHRQIAVWRDTETLFTHALKVTRNNYVALTSLAGIDVARGRMLEATAKVEHAIKIAPRFPRAQYLMGMILQMQGRMQEAIPHLEAATGIEVAVAGRARLVLSLLDARRLAEADAILSQIMAAMPNDPNAALMKAALLKESGQISEALDLFRKVTAVYQPPTADNPTLNFELAELYGLSGQSANASEFYVRAIEQSPGHVNALNNFAWILATAHDDSVRNGALAVRHAENACEITQWKQPVMMGTLAAAYAEAGRFDDAVKMATRARDLAKAGGAGVIARRNEELLELYRQGKPCREAN